MFYCLGLSGTLLVSLVIVSYLFSVLITRFLTRVGAKALKNLLSYSSDYFDDPKNAPSNLALAISSDLQLINKLGGLPLSFIFQTLFGYLITYGLSFYFSWKLTLAVVIFCPLLLFLNAKGNLFPLATKEELQKKPDSVIAADCITNSKTVKVFGLA